MNGATRVAPFNKEYYKGDYLYMWSIYFNLGYRFFVSHFQPSPLEVRTSRPASCEWPGLAQRGVLVFSTRIPWTEQMTMIHAYILYICITYMC